MRPFAVYPDSFDGDTLGWWRFGERGGLLTDIVAGKVLTNFGAEPLDEGYRFVHTDPDYMSAAFADQPERSALTIEGWLRGWATGVDVRGYIFHYAIDATTRLWLQVIRSANPIIQAYLRLGNVTVALAQWGCGTAFLDSPEWWHFAVVLDAVSDPKTFSLFVNGVLRQQVSGGAIDVWPAGNCDLFLSRAEFWAGDYISAVLDEMRMSSVARYAATFPITRFQDGRRLGLRGPEILATAGGIP